MAAIEYLVGGGSVATVFGVAAPFAGRYAKRAMHEIVNLALADVRQQVADLSLKWAKETGGNSGGFRQAINESRVEINAVQRDLAYLKGALDAQGRLTPPPGAPQ